MMKKHGGEIWLIEEEVRELQNPDGGFPCRDKKGNPSSLNRTSVWIGKLIRHTSKEAKESLHKALEWVLSTQSDEGAFVEPEELASIPKLPPWVPSGKPTPNMPQLVAYLLQAGYEDRDETKRAMTYLLSYWQNPDGSFKKKYLVWSLIEVLKRSGLTEDAKPVQEAIKATRQYFRKIENRNDPPALLWCLNTLKSAGMEKDHPLVKEVFEQLMSLRNDDGGWSTEDLEGKIQSQTDPLFTKNVLSTLRAYQLI